MQRILLIATTLALLLLACYEAPLSRPEQSRVEHRLDGLWVVQEKPGAQYDTWLIVPFDERVDCMVSTTYSIVDGELKLEGATTWRGWVTSIAGEAFISLEPVAQMLADHEGETGWLNARLTFRDDGTLVVEGLEYEYKDLRHVKDPDELARRVERDIRDAALFSKPVIYHRADRANPIEKKIRQQLLGEGKN
jgi:hypothetical protein